MHLTADCFESASAEQQCQEHRGEPSQSCARQRVLLDRAPADMCRQGAPKRLCPVAVLLDSTHAQASRSCSGRSCVVFAFLHRSL